MRTGAQLFARYAYAPNELGYCGPAETDALRAAARGAEIDVAPIAARFSGAWPYLVALAELAGIDDPLDPRVGRAYWTGSPLLDTIDQKAFGARLLDRISAQAGSYWQHLDADLLPEASATHGFHVFGVYPWSRLLGGPGSEQALSVLDSCRIGWGQVIGFDGDAVLLRMRRLAWDGCQLRLPGADVQRVSRGFVDDPAPGEWLAVHWGSVCDRLAGAEMRELQRWTARQLRVTNARLARTGRCAPG